MDLARVIGRVVCTQKDETGTPLVAIDAVGAGAGERIFYVTGREASFAFIPDHVPTDATIVGIVDQVNLL